MKIILDYPYTLKECVRPLFLGLPISLIIIKTVLYYGFGIVM